MCLAYWNWIPLWSNWIPSTYWNWTNQQHCLLFMVDILPSILLIISLLYCFIQQHRHGYCQHHFVRCL